MDSQWQLGHTADLINKGSLAAASNLVSGTAFCHTISSIAQGEAMATNDRLDLKLYSS